MVVVSDTGVGIPEENLAKLFEPLFTTRAKGIGLGLPLVRALVEGHGGDGHGGERGGPGRGLLRRVAHSGEWTRIGLGCRSEGAMSL